MPKKSKRTRKPYRASADPRIAALNERRDTLAEQARRRQWLTSGEKPPDHFDYVIEEPGGMAPPNRAERRYLESEAAFKTGNRKGA